jgi:hydrogenase expression/formation protein HypD
MAEEIAQLLGDRQINLMEVCGTHTVSIFRSGLKSLLPSSLRLISGPGCPVCVTPQSKIDTIIAYGREPDTIITTFGDMLKVPGTESSLREEKSRGADIRLVYSPLESLSLARDNPEKKVIFLAIGFETTIPTGAATVIEAQKSGLDNFFLIPAGKLIPPAMELLLSQGDAGINGFLCPGHVSAIIGTRPYLRIVEKFGVPCVVAGFEPLDILTAIRELLLLIKEGKPEVRNLYPRVVREGGNPRARDIMDEVFQVADTEWRGLGVIPQSGLRMRPEFEKYDISLTHPVEIPPSRENPSCICGEILRGVSEPPDCPAFKNSCSPAHPLGPCMVSSEGTCAAWHRYGGMR